MGITITEALAERRLIEEKKLPKKEEFVGQYLVRQDIVKDPLADGEGATTEKRVAAELQAIKDLRQRLVDIRRGIAKANVETSLQIGDASRTIQEWLTWKREIAPRDLSMLQGFSNHIQRSREQVNQRARQASKDELERDPRAYELAVAVDEVALHKQIEDIQETLGTLDGRLSLINAQTEIDI
jgi:hypothetical protein